MFCRVETRDDKNDTYITAIRNSITANVTQMIVCVVTNNKKDRYDAIKKQCCIDSPGELTPAKLL